MGNTTHSAPVPPVFVVNAALGLRRLLLRAADAVVPPHLAVFDHMLGMVSTMLLHTAAKHRIADLLAAGPLTAEALAERTGVPAERLDRVLTALISIGIFKRDAEGRYANNHAAKGLLSGRTGSARGFAEWFGYEPMMRAWASLPHTLQSGQGAFQHVHGRSVWEWLDADADARNAFVDGMSAITEMAAPAIAGAFPFAECAKVCDVGGGVGIVLAAVLQRHAHLRGVLYDAEAMVKAAPPRLEAAGVADRVDLVSGSFLDSVPRGADTYLFKTVLHNWSDDLALRILRNCRAAMDPGHRVLAVEFVRERAPAGPLEPYMDVVGMVVFQNGRERAVADFRRLYEEAGFSLGRVVPIPGTMSIIEGIARRSR